MSITFQYKILSSQVRWNKYIVSDLKNMNQHKCSTVILTDQSRILKFSVISACNVKFLVMAFNVIIL